MVHVKRGQCKLNMSFSNTVSVSESISVVSCLKMDFECSEIESNFVNDPTLVFSSRYQNENR